VKGIPDVDAGNVHGHGNEFEESVQRIHDEGFDPDLFDQPRQVFKRGFREVGSEVQIRILHRSQSVQF